MEKRLNKPTRQVNDGGSNSAQTANQGVQSKGHIVIPYTQGLCESIKRICGVWHPNSLQGWHYHQKPSGLPQGQRPYGQPK